MKQKFPYDTTIVCSKFCLFYVPTVWGPTLIFAKISLRNRALSNDIGPKILQERRLVPHGRKAGPALFARANSCYFLLPVILPQFTKRRLLKQSAITRTLVSWNPHRETGSSNFVRNFIDFPMNGVPILLTRSHYHRPLPALCCFIGLSTDGGACTSCLKIDWMKDTVENERCALVWQTLKMRWVSNERVLERLWSESNLRLH